MGSSTGLTIRRLRTYNNVNALKEAAFFIMFILYLDENTATKAVVAVYGGAKPVEKPCAGSNSAPGAFHTLHFLTITFESPYRIFAFRWRNRT